MDPSHHFLAALFVVMAVTGQARAATPFATDFAEIAATHDIGLPAGGDYSKRYSSHATSENLAALMSGLSARVDADTGDYQIVCEDPAWKFRGSFNVPLQNITKTRNRDNVGVYQQIAFDWRAGQAPMTGRIRLYDGRGLALFSQTCGSALEKPPAAFPDFTTLPPALHIFSYGPHEFAPPYFTANEISTPWLLFDDQADAVIISPASHFLVASMSGDGRKETGSGFNSNLRNLPAGFTQQTLAAFGKGINKTWEAWGRALVDLQGAKRPTYDADVVLKYLGYWTDNGAYYYYNYDLDKGYAGTLLSLVERYRQEQIPIRYLQLDSWWYYKSTTDADGKQGKETKSNRLPAGEWNRYGGLLEYKAHTNLFPNGLAAFRKVVGLPLITHNRWIDPASPYHRRYKISGLAAVDPEWWAHIAGYLKASGIVTYEQDWLDRIYTYSPAFSSDAGTGEAFLDNMARACKEQGITVQYCMPYPCFFMQGSRYENVTTIRVSGDRFNTNHWNDFLYTSRLAASVGIWPWADVCHSTEPDNVLLSTLSAGPVGIGDALGTETRTNLMRAVREDGVIVKPDRPIMPLDRSYINDAKGMEAPMVCGTFTEHGRIRTGYFFAFNRPEATGSELRFSPGEQGLSGPVYVYDYATGTARRMDASAEVRTPLPKGATVFFIVAPVGKSGIAFVGDKDKFVSTGKQRIASLRDEPGRLALDVVFAETEASATLHGYADAAPKVVTPSGQAGTVQYDARTQHFVVEIRPDPAAPVDKSTGDSVRRMTVFFETQAKALADSPVPSRGGQAAVRAFPVCVPRPQN